MKRLTIPAIILAMLGVFIIQASALEVEPHIIGYVQTLRGDVYAINDDTKVVRYQDRKEARLLGETDPVYEHDTILTGVDGKCQIVFEDGMYLIIGPESMMKMATFNWDFDDNGANALTMQLGPGIFRYLTGKIVQKNPDAMAVDTPISIIGIRGTEVLSVEMVEKNPVPGIVQGLNSLGSPGDWEDSSIAFKNLVNDFIHRLKLLEIMTQTVHSELHAHLMGKVSTPLQIRHKQQNVMTQVPRGFELFSSLGGPQLPGPVSEQTRQWSFIVPMDNSAPLPPEYRGTLGDGSNGPDLREDSINSDYSNSYSPY